MKGIWIFTFLVGLTLGEDGEGLQSERERRFMSAFDKRFLKEEMEQLTKRIVLELQTKRLADLVEKAREAPTELPAAAATAKAPTSASEVVDAAATPAATPAAEIVTNRTAASKSGGDVVTTEGTPTAFTEKTTNDFIEALETRLQWIEKILKLRQKIFGDFGIIDLGRQFDQLMQLFQVLQQAEAMQQQQAEVVQQQGFTPFYKTFSKEKKLPNGQVWKEKGSLTVQQSNNNQTRLVVLSQVGELVNGDSNNNK